MKMMLVGAIMASTTNLIFVGLVKSGPTMNTVQLDIGQQRFDVETDEVGNWSVQIPAKTFESASSITVQSQPEKYDQALSLTSPVQKYQSQQGVQLYVQAIGGDNQIYQDERLKDIIVRGTVSNLTEQDQLQKVSVSIGSGEAIEAKIDQQNWSVVIPGQRFNNQQQLSVLANAKVNGQNQELRQQHQFSSLEMKQPTSRMSLADVNAVQTDSGDAVEVKGKVIVPYSKVWLVMGIIFDNMASGLAGAVFIAFLSSLTSVSFTAMQYAIFSSLMLLLPKMIGGYSGTIVTNFGYSTFFFMTFLMGLPILLLVIWVGKLLNQLKRS